MSMQIQKMANLTGDVSSVSVVGVSWLGVLPTVVSVIASSVAVAWIIQRWYWQAKDRKAKRDEHK